MGSDASKFRNRRDFIAQGLSAFGALGLLHVTGCRAGSSSSAGRDEPVGSVDAAGSEDASPLYSISLAEWSLHRALRGGSMTNLDFPLVSRQRFDIGAIEYVNQFFQDKARDTAYLTELKSRCDGEGVRSLLIMCDEEGLLGDPRESARTQAVENHYRWVEAARFLGCHSIRVNAASEGDWTTQRDLAADGLRRLTEFGSEHDINVIVENHGGLSSNGVWLSEVMQAVDHEDCGTLPDFGNFEVNPGEWYDRYQGVEELMPFAKAVSAKSFDFDENGNTIRTDFYRMMTLVLDAGYRGFVGIEYEGEDLGEDDGILATKRLLEKVRSELAPKYT